MPTFGWKREASQALVTFSARLARKHYLVYHCGSDHPVLQIEMNLLAMARAKLLDRLNAEFQPHRLIGLRSSISQSIEASARQWVIAHVDDVEIRTSIMQGVEMEIAATFPQLH